MESLPVTLNQSFPKYRSVFWVCPTTTPIIPQHNMMELESNIPEEKDAVNDHLAIHLVLHFCGCFSFYHFVRRFCNWLAAELLALENFIYIKFI